MQKAGSILVALTHLARAGHENCRKCDALEVEKEKCRLTCVFPWRSKMICNSNIFTGKRLLLVDAAFHIFIYERAPI